jgi:hypothetical protein
VRAARAGTRMGVGGEGNKVGAEGGRVRSRPRDHLSAEGIAQEKGREELIAPIPLVLRQRHSAPTHTGLHRLPHCVALRAVPTIPKGLMRPSRASSPPFAYPQTSGSGPSPLRPKTAPRQHPVSLRSPSGMLGEWRPHG